MPNSPAEIERRVALGRVALGQVTWPRALILLMGGNCFMILAQALVALVFLLRGRESPWKLPRRGGRSTRRRWISATWCYR